VPAAVRCRNRSGYGGREHPLIRTSTSSMVSLGLLPGIFIKYKIFYKNGFLIIHKFEDYSELMAIKTSNPGFTIEDCSVYFLAKEFNAILLTGEKKLRRAALEESIEAKGIFWVFDELFKMKIISKSVFYSKLSELKEVNTWLPEVEFNKRLKE
jgi:hypothetical protein